MPNTQELLLKYSKMFILGALVILIIEFIVSGNPLQGEHFYGYLVANILPLFFLCLNFGLYEYGAVKKYKENINMTICCMSTALFAVLWSIKFSKEIQSINMTAYRPYAQVGIIIFMFMAGVFYLFYKKGKIKYAEYKILDDNDAENKTDVKTSLSITRFYEALLGSINGLTIVLFLIAYSFILSI